MAVKQSGGVQSVERVFELLELITDAGGNVTLSELASSTDLPLPTIHRLLRTLVGAGYIRQLPNRRYALGPRLIRLGEGATQQLGAMAMPQLEQLVSKLGETANMAVLDTDMVVYIAQVPSPHSMRMFTEVGRRAHTHDTGVGKALLAQLDNKTVRKIIADQGMPTPTIHSIGTRKSKKLESAASQWPFQMLPRRQQFRSPARSNALMKSLLTEQFLSYARALNSYPPN